jgi:thioredoxin
VPVDVTEATFQSEVVERSRQLPVVVDFWAEWCGPCKALSPALERAEAARSGEVVLAKVDIDSNQRLGAQFQVQGIPAVKALRDGRVVDEFVGALPPAKVEVFFDSLVPSRVDELLAALDGLLAEFVGVPAGSDGADTRDLLRRAIVGILSEADPTARAYRRRLSAALG